MDAILLFGFSNAVVAGVLVLLVLGITRAWDNPYVSRGLWLLVLAKLIIPPLAPLPLGWLSIEVPREQVWVTETIHALPPSDMPNATTTDIPQPKRDSPFQSGLRASPVTAPQPIAECEGRLYATVPRQFLLLSIGAVWLAGSLCLNLIVVLRVSRFQRLVNQARPAPDDFQTRAAQLAKRLGLDPVPLVRWVDGHLPPLVWSLFRRATIVLPSRLLDRLGLDRIDAVLAHELMHVRRGDRWARWLEFFVISVYWWHPLVWIARRRLHEAEERCCDADVLRTFPDLRRVYAEALLTTLDFLNGSRPPEMLATGITCRHTLTRRFEMILNSRPTARPSRWLGAMFLLAAVALLAVSPVTISQANSTDPPDGSGESGALSNAAAGSGLSVESMTILAGADPVADRQDASSDSTSLPRSPDVVEADPLPGDASREIWNLTLKECVMMALANSRQFRIMTNQGKGGVTMLASSAVDPVTNSDIRDHAEDLVADVETTYWFLWRRDRELRELNAGRELALQTWRGTYAALLKDEGAERDESQCREQYFLFRAKVEDAVASLHRFETQLRFLLGLAASDGRRIRPTEEPRATMDPIDWQDLLDQSLFNNSELSAQRQKIRKLESEPKDAENSREIQTKLSAVRAALEKREIAAVTRLANALRDVELTRERATLNLNRQLSAQRQVDAVGKAYATKTVSLDLMLDAQRRHVDANTAAHGSLADHAQSRVRLDGVKGTLLARFGLKVIDDRGR